MHTEAIAGGRSGGGHGRGCGVCACASWETAQYSHGVFLPQVRTLDCAGDCSASHPRLPLLPEVADAVCWWLVGEVRSSPHARAGLLGSFYVVVLFAQSLVGPWAIAAIVISVFHPAAFPRSPDGQVSGATSITRATELFAGWQVSLGWQASPDAKALTIYCAATSSPARADAPMATEEAPEATRDRRAPTVASPLGGPPPTKTLDGVARLPAHDAAGPAC